jgi:hypothetical protein
MAEIQGFAPSQPPRLAEANALAERGPDAASAVILNLDPIPPTSDWSGEGNKSMDNWTWFRMCSYE